jgi:hypothetical protein
MQHTAIRKSSALAIGAKLIRASISANFFISLQIEVGTLITQCPPRRSRRAELPHRAPRRTRTLELLSLSFYLGYNHAVLFRFDKAIAHTRSTIRGGGKSQKPNRWLNWVQVMLRF